MNINKAKEQIKNAMIAYFTKDESGEYIVPIEKQRPVFLMGPPGIGKTAIMEQIASEMGVGLLSYSMTHHTRQSALGLPFISHKNYNGLECEVSEYTMSEIIAAVYDMMQETGVKEGILFLDEINCVSETLAPVMLQFLQYKIFGRHRVPEGWIVVTAGNPPEYNHSVREFDIVTWDRLKRVDVEPDFDVWKKYAYQKGMHASVTTYLEIRKSDFYSVESTVDGKMFVTARGWEDLSQMIQLYERNGLTVDVRLIGQYLQKPQIAKNFAAYYDLFLKYQIDYQVDKILAGQAPDEIKERAQKAKFDEKLSLIGMLLDAVGEEVNTVMQSDRVQKELTASLSKLKANMSNSEQSPSVHLDELLAEKRKQLASGKKSGALSREAQAGLKQLIDWLENQKAEIFGIENGEEAFGRLKKAFDEQRKALKKSVAKAGKSLSNLFLFCEEVFPKGQELVILVTELTINPITSGFINKYGCKEYFQYNKELLIYDRQQEIEKELKHFIL